MRTSEKKSRQINCEQTITAAQHHILVKTAINAKNFSSGYISHTIFSNSEGILQRLKTKLSVPECQAATGTEELFYRCVNNNVNKLTECSRKYRFE